VVQKSSVAVIDIGSNSIKLLVAARDAAGGLVALSQRTLDVRISAGINSAVPQLAEDGMVRGLAAIEQLLLLAAPFSPTATVLVATSAVRDAANGADFRARVQVATGHAIRILTGDEEANLIGRGLLCDLTLAGWQDFYVFDLGGGSLECLAFQRRNISQERSLRLGCVRLTERFVSDPAVPVTAAVASALALHVRDELGKSGFRFNLGPAAGAVFTGGSMTGVRAIGGARHNLALANTSPVVSAVALAALVEEVLPLTVEQRQKIPGLPAARADVFPAALITMLAVAKFAGIGQFHHSLYNLRWGVASEALG
jgi:exopolyphosphatase/guanosine-5'-triphosphate,3'-diphosphate pyrophosphatase